MTITNPIELAKSLPRPLLKFFARYPPRNPPTDPIAPTTQLLHDAKRGKDVAVRFPNNRAIRTTPPALDAAYNPFLPWQNPRTGKWREPVYSLREQKEMCRLAQAAGVEPLLPWSIKMSGVREARRALGSRVKGTGEGQRVKGHMEERRMREREETIKTAMEGMPRLVRQWKKSGHGRLRKMFYPK